MPRGPQGQKRPTSEVQAAVMVGKIATGQIEEPQKRRLFILDYGCHPTGPKPEHSTKEHGPAMLPDNSRRRPESNRQQEG